MALLERAAALAPDNAGILGMLGRALLARAFQQSRRREDRVEDEPRPGSRPRSSGRRALAPDAAHLSAMLGDVALLGGTDHEGAVSPLSQAVRMAPSREQYQLRLAEALLRTRQFDRAVSYLTVLATRGRAQQIRDAARMLLGTVVQRQLGASTSALTCGLLPEAKP